MGARELGALVTLTLEGQEVVGEIVRVTARHLVVQVRIPHDTAAMFPPVGSVTWADGQVQEFERAQARAVTVVEVTLPVVEEDEAKAEIHLKRRIAVDVRTADGKLAASGHSFTVSLAGGKFDLNRKLTPDARYRLSLYLPDGMLKLDARALQPDALGKQIMTFEDVSPEARERLAGFLQESLRALKARKRSTQP